MAVFRTFCRMFGFALFALCVVFGTNTVAMAGGDCNNCGISWSSVFNKNVDGTSFSSSVPAVAGADGTWQIIFDYGTVNGENVGLTTISGTAQCFSDSSGYSCYCTDVTASNDNCFCHDDYGLEKNTCGAHNFYNFTENDNLFSSARACSDACAGLCASRGANSSAFRQDVFFGTCNSGSAGYGGANTYNLTYKCNNGTTTTTVRTETHAYGESFKPLQMPGCDRGTGWHFTGWDVSDTNPTVEVPVNNTNITWIFNESKVFSAHWKKNTFNVEYSDGNGVIATAYPSECTYGEACFAGSLISGLTLPTSSELRGWTCTADTGDGNGNCASASYPIGGDISQATPVNGDTIHLNAVIRHYTNISFNANGGSGGQTAKVKAYYGEAMPPITNIPPTKTGYDFQGWYDAQSGGTQYYTASGVSARNWDKLDDNYTLYARWTPHAYILRYYCAGLLGPVARTQYVTYNNSNWDLLAVNSVCGSRTGMTFDGWQVSGESNKWADRYNTYHNITWTYTEDKTLVATWRQSTGNVYLYTNCPAGNIENMQYTFTGSPNSSVTITGTYGQKLPNLSTVAAFSSNGNKPTCTSGTYGNQKNYIFAGYYTAADPTDYQSWKDAERYYDSYGYSVKKFETVGALSLYAVWLDPDDIGWSSGKYWRCENGNCAYANCPSPYIYNDDYALTLDGCYLTTFSGYHVATAGGQQVNCNDDDTLCVDIDSNSPNGYCPGGVKLYYGETGGRSQLQNWACSKRASSPSDCMRKVDLYKNDGSGAKYDGNTHCCYYNTSCSLPSTSNLSQTGYHFTGGWGTADTCTASSSSVTVTSVLPETPTYYACKNYNECNEVVLNDRTNGGVPTNNCEKQDADGNCRLYKKIYDTKWYENNTCTDEVDYVSAPTKANSAFVGYYESANNTATRVASSGNPSVLSTTWTVMEPKTVYAQYQTCTCDYNSATDHITSCTVSSVSNNQCTYTISSCPTGYNLQGQTGYTVSGNTVTGPAGVYTYHPKCVEHIYAITLDSSYNNYFNAQISSSPQVLYLKYGDGWYSDSNAIYSISSLSRKPVYLPSEGYQYVFGGFYTQRNGGGTQVIDANGNIVAGSTSFNQDTTLYAKWIQKCSSSGYNIYDATSNECYTSQFQVMATVPIDGVFKFTLSAAGEFIVDWGDGNVQTISRLSNTTNTEYSHIYGGSIDSNRNFVIKFYSDNKTLKYSGADGVATISFYPARTYVTGFDGSLGQLFPTLEKGSNLSEQPRFIGTFKNCSLVTKWPENPDLFDGITGAAPNMFEKTFAGTGITTIPESLFAHNSVGAQAMFLETFAYTPVTTIPARLFLSIDGAAKGLFNGTFKGTSITEVPETLFSNVNTNQNIFNPVMDGMFADTFAYCTDLTDIYGAMFRTITSPADSLFYETFAGCVSLNSIPYDLFKTMSGRASDASNMFYRMFYGDTNIKSFYLDGYQTVSYIPQQFFGDLNTTGYDNSGDVATDMFKNTMLATACPAGTYVFSTGLEDEYSPKVSCADCPPAYPSSVNNNTHGIESCYVNATCSNQYPLTCPVHSSTCEYEDDTGWILYQDGQTDGNEHECEAIIDCDNGYDGEECTPVGTTLTLDRNGGSGGTGALYTVYNTGVYTDVNHSNAATSITVPTGVLLTITYNTGVNNMTINPGTVNKEFTGYFKNNSKYIDASGNIINPGGFDEAKSYTSNQTWTAQWDNPEITLPTPDSRIGYDFEGWYDAQSGGNLVGEAGDSYTVTGDATIYAYWTPNTTSITFDDNIYVSTSDQTGAAPDSPADNLEKTVVYNSYWEDSKGDEITSVNVPSDENYDFDGYWTAKYSGGLQITSSDGTFTADSLTSFSDSNSSTVYAHWIEKAAPTYNVTYDCGTGDGTAPANDTATANAGFIPASNSCTKTGYEFDGWLVSGTSDVKPAGISFTWEYTEDKTLTAQWTACTSSQYFDATNNTCMDCPTDYPHAVDNATAITQCYSDTKMREWTGTPNRPQTIPENCDTVESWETCSISACEYIAYSNATGDGDGVLKEGCSSNNENCDETPNEVTAKVNSYVSGVGTCAKCESFNEAYPKSYGGNIDSNKCYAELTPTCTQIPCVNPDSNGCTVTCSSCDCAGNKYISYVDGSTDGATSESCTQEVATLEATANHYVDGNSCPACNVAFTNTVSETTNTSTCPDETTTKSHATATSQSYDQTCYHQSSSGGNISSDSCTGTQSCSNTKTYGTCSATACESGYELKNGNCEPICYTISFDTSVNGGSGTQANVYKLFDDDKWYSDNNCTTEITNITVVATKTNAVFGGYYTASTDGSQKVDENGDLAAGWTVSENTTLYPQYDCNDGWQANGERIAGKCLGQIICHIPNPSADDAQEGIDYVVYNGGQAVKCPVITCTSPAGAEIRYRKRTGSVFNYKYAYTKLDTDSDFETISTVDTTNVNPYYRISAGDDYEVIGHPNATNTDYNNNPPHISYHCEMRRAAGYVNLSSYSGETAYPNTIQISVTGNSGNLGTVTSSDTSVATVSRNNNTIIVTPVSVGTATITVPCDASTNYTAGSAEYIVTVHTNNIEVTEPKGANDPDAVAGTDYLVYNGTQRNCIPITVTYPTSGATVKYGLTQGTYDLDSVPVTNVSDSKTVYYKVTAENFDDLYGDYPCDVAKADGSVTIDPTEALFTPNGTDTKSFNITNNTSNGSLSISVSPSSLATASINGTTVTVTSKNVVGDAAITVTSAETANYNAASATYNARMRKGQITLKPNLNGGTATVAGTTTLYVISGDNSVADSGVYTDSGYTQKMSVGSTITIPERDNGGYTFDGFYSDADGGTQYIGGNGRILSAGINAGKQVEVSADWYAHWTANKYNINYNMNSGTNYSGAPTEYTFDVGTTINGTPTKAGSTFAGWTGTGITGSPVSSVTIPATDMGDKNYTANWSCNNGYENSDFATFLGDKTSIDGTGYSYKLNNNAAGTGGTNGANLEKGEWETYFEYGTVRGITTCRSNNSLSIMTGVTVKEPESSGGRLCWCKVTGFIPSDDSNAVYETVMPQWLYHPDNGFTTESNCNNNCAQRCGEYFATKANVREGAYPTLTSDQCIVKTNTVNYHLNGGSLPNGVSNPDSYRITDLPMALPVPVRQSFNFDGWYETANFQGSAIAQIVAGTYGNKDYYAKWSCPTGYEINNDTCQPSHYTITYVLNGGDASYTDSENVPTGYDYGTAVTITEEPTKTNATFVKWIETNSKTISISATDTGNKTYTANWQCNTGYKLNADNACEIETYTITYYPDGGSYTGNPESYTVETETFAFNDASKEGSSFGGWFTTAEAATNNDLAKKITGITKGSRTGNLDLYARWGTNSYSITYECGDSNNTSASFSYAFGATANHQIQTVAQTCPDMTGYVSNGWACIRTDTSVSVNDDIRSGITQWTIPANIVCAAQWNTITYDITYNNMEGADEFDGPVTYTVEDTPLILQNPTKTGYAFNGWYDNDGFDGTAMTQISEGSTGDKVFYAKWTPKTYTVNFNANGGLGTKESVVCSYYNINCDIENDVENEINRVGYDFIGWSTSSGQNNSVDFTEYMNSYPEPYEESIDLYAVWTPVSIDLNYTNSNGTNEPSTCVYDTTFDMPTPADKPGYTFKGWIYTK